MKKIILLVALATMGLSCQKEDITPNSDVSASEVYANGKKFRDVYSASFNSAGIPTILIDQNKPEPVSLPGDAELFFKDKLTETSKGVVGNKITYKCEGSWWNGGWQAAKAGRSKDMYMTASPKGCGNQIELAFRFIPKNADPNSYRTKAVDFWYRIQVTGQSSVDGRDTRYTAHQMLRSNSTEYSGPRPFYDYAYGIGGSVLADFFRASDWLDLAAWDNCYGYSRLNSRWLMYDCLDQGQYGSNRLDLWMEDGPGKNNVVFREYKYSPW